MRGKTHALCQQVARRVLWDNEKFLWVQKTKKLIKQTRKDLRKAGLSKADLTPIYKKHDDDKESVIKRIFEHFNEADDSKGQVVLITEAAFELVKDFHRAETWVLIFDEAPKAAIGFEPKLRSTHRMLTDHLAIGTGVGAYAPIFPKPNSGIDAILRGAADDDNYQKLHAVAHRICAKGWDTYVDPDTYNALISGQKEQSTLQIYALRNAQALFQFKEVIVASALLKKTLFYKLMSLCGVEFVPYAAADASLRYKAHPHGDRLTIHYLSVPRWSKRLMRENEHLLSDYENYILSQIDGQRFVFLGNKSNAHDALTRDGIRLPNDPFGLNEYQDIDIIAILSAYNAKPHYRKWLESRGVTIADIEFDMHCQRVYQAVMRISLRDPDSTTDKVIFVPDERTAIFLNGLFPSAKMVEVPIDIPDGIGRSGPKRIHESGATKQAAYHGRKKELKALVSSIAPVDGIVLSQVGERYESFQEEKELVTGQPPIEPMAWQLNLYGSIHKTGAMETRPIGSVEEIAAFMEERSKIMISKDKNKLFNFTDFSCDPSRSRKSRDAIGASVFVLDNDSR